MYIDVCFLNKHVWGRARECAIQKGCRVWRSFHRFEAVHFELRDFRSSLETFGSRDVEIACKLGARENYENCSDHLPLLGPPTKWNDRYADQTWIARSILRRMCTSRAVNNIISLSCSFDYDQTLIIKKRDKKTMGKTRKIVSVRCDRVTERK